MQHFLTVLQSLYDREGHHVSKESMRPLRMHASGHNTTSCQINCRPSQRFHLAACHFGKCEECVGDKCVVPRGRLHPSAVNT